MLDALIQGLLLGGYYAILAAGLSLMFGVARFINLAHGDLAILGAYLVLFGVEVLNLSPWIALLISLPVMGAVGWCVQRFIFERSPQGAFLLPLLTTFGLGAVLQNGMFGVFGSDTRSLADYIGDLSWDSWDITDTISVGKLPVIIFLIAVVVLLGLQALLSWSRMGRAIRATASDPEAAELCGVNARSVYRQVAAISFALAGLAGALLAMRALVMPYSGPVQLIYAFEAIVIGGVGSIWGTLLGGIALGVAQSLGAAISTQWFQLAGHFLFLLVLGWKLYQNHAHHHGGWLPLIKHYVNRYRRRGLSSMSANRNVEQES